MLLLASAVLVGAALGLRHNVFVLVPASLVAVGVVFAANLAGGDSLGAALLITTGSAFALQLGYFMGIMASRADALEETVGASDRPVDQTYHGAEIVYLSRHWLAKTR